MTASAKAGRYELVEEIGRGAMGIVYRANDPVIGRAVAVKTMRLAGAGTGLSHDELLARFQTEARAAGRLNHPNIVVVHDAGEEEGLLYITMELVEGPSLQALIEARQTFPLPRLLRLIEQACSALDFAHQHKIIHRDIKPANLMLTPDDTLKITDFGTAKILQIGAMQTAQIIGTPSYMSPEQIKGRPVDGRSDIFSLGVVLYELLTGQKPFAGESVTTVIYKIVNEDPVPPRGLDASIHPGLSAIVSRALAKPVDARFQTCREFVQALQNYGNYPGASTAVPVLLPGSATPRPAAQGARMPGPLAAAGPRSQNPSVARPATLSTRPQTLPAKPRGSVWLVLFLLAVIGYASYRVQPAVLEIWQRSKADRDAMLVLKQAAPGETSAPPPALPSPTTIASNETIPTSPTSTEATPPKSQAPLSPAERAKPAPAAASPAPEKAPVVPQSHADVPPPTPSQPAARPPYGPAPVANGAAITTGAAPATGAASQTTAPYKPSRPPASEAAAAWQRRISTILANSDVADQVQVVAAGNTLTLTGKLGLRAHRRLLARLQNVPDRVQIIDDIDDAQ